MARIYEAVYIKPLEEQGPPSSCMKSHMLYSLSELKEKSTPWKDHCENNLMNNIFSETMKGFLGLFCFVFFKELNCIFHLRNTTVVWSFNKVWKRFKEAFMTDFTRMHLRALQHIICMMRHFSHDLKSGTEEEQLPWLTGVMQVYSVICLALSPILSLSNIGSR